MRSAPRRRDNRSAVCFGKLYPFKHRGNILAETDAHGRYAKLYVALLHQIDQRAGNARTGAAERMTERDSPTVQVHLVIDDLQQP